MKRNTRTFPMCTKYYYHIFNGYFDLIKSIFFIIVRFRCKVVLDPLDKPWLAWSHCPEFSSYIRAYHRYVKLHQRGVFWCHVVTLKSPLPICVITRLLFSVHSQYCQVRLFNKGSPHSKDGTSTINHYSVDILFWLQNQYFLHRVFNTIWKLASCAGKLECLSI